MAHARTAHSEMPVPEQSIVRGFCTEYCMMSVLMSMNLHWCRACALSWKLGYFTSERRYTHRFWHCGHALADGMLVVCTAPELLEPDAWPHLHTENPYAWLLVVHTALSFYNLMLIARMYRMIGKLVIGCLLLAQPRLSRCSSPTPFAPLFFYSELATWAS